MGMDVLGLLRAAGRGRQKGYILLLVPVVLVGISILALRTMNHARTAMRVSGGELNYLQTGMCVQQCAALAVNASEKRLNDNVGVVNHSETCSCNPADHETISCTDAFSSVIDSGITNCYGAVMNRTSMDIAVTCKKQVEAAQTIQENVGFSEYPIFQFAVFFEKNLDFSPGAHMGVGGRVHSNDVIQIAPGGGNPSGDMYLYDWLTTPASIMAKAGPHGAGTYFPRMDGSGEDKFNFSNSDYQPIDELIPGWKSWQKAHRVAYGDQGGSCGRVKRLSVPLRDTSNMHGIIEWRNTPVTDDADLKAQKFAWRADLIYKNGWYNNDMSAAGLGPNPLGAPGAAPWAGKLNMAGGRAVFADSQEGILVKVLPIDLSKLRQRAGDDVIYLYDAYVDGAQANQDVGGFLLFNGAKQTRPITIVSNSRIFMWGDFNTTKTYVLPGGGGFGAYPAAIVCDIYMQLSNVWNGKDTLCCGAAYTPIHAVNPAEVCTLNACIMAGMVEKNGVWTGAYQNFVHFIEDWFGVPFVYSGSSVALWGSKLHLGSVSTHFYHPPDRQWAFDPMYKKMVNMPPATPRVVEPKLNTWEMSRR
jgi:Tfp pilus assembly protein PilX